MSKILVTGGSGYIGSHTIIDLLDSGSEVVSIDNYLRSMPTAIDNIEKVTGKRITNYETDICDRAALGEVFKQEPGITGIIHFAALKSVPESVAQPLLYYRNNLDSLLNLLELCEEHQIAQFVFSSSCSVYGNATALPVTEGTPFEEAESPYGRTKQISEKMIGEYAKVAKSTRFVLLRYFNPVGAHESNLIGESPKDGVVFNVFPRITGTALGQYPEFQVFGSDYPTRDGTCVRDYIHVMDIAHAHTLALDYLAPDGSAPKCDVFNLGTGIGVTVLEVIAAFERVSGLQLKYSLRPRREGDVMAIYANNEKAKRLLGWEAIRSLDTMVSTAWAWERKKAGR